MSEFRLSTQAAFSDQQRQQQQQRPGQPQLLSWRRDVPLTLILICAVPMETQSILQIYFLRLMAFATCTLAGLRAFATFA